MTRKQIIEIFQALTLSEKESLLTELQTMVTIEKNSPPKSPLEIAWKEIIQNDFFDYYSIFDPMKDLMEALCTTQKENLLCADLIYKDLKSVL
mgnify:FL=1